MATALRTLSVAQGRGVRAAALAAAGVFFALALLVQLGVTIDVEWRVQQAAQGLRAAALEVPMRTISLLGTGWVLLPLTVLGALVLRARDASFALSLVAAGVGATVVANLAKVLAIRQRPNTVLWSYPSAHTFGIVVFVTLLLYTLWAVGAPARWRALTLGVGVVATAGVGASRLYLNAHWIGDVVGGFAGGLAFALGAMLALERALRRNVAAPATVARPAGAVSH
jgi:membrane-associated phospholipid phosphatase